MSLNKVEFKILKDTEDTNIELENMSLGASKAFLILIESLTKIIEQTEGHNSMRLQIVKGSVVVSANGSEEQIFQIKEEFNKVVENEADNEDVIKPWRELQKLINKNGLQYEVNFVENSKTTNVTDFIKTKRVFRSKTVKTKVVHELRFYEAKLIEIGGKRPNFHVQADSSNEMIISCTEDHAKKIMMFLYSNIKFSAWFNIKSFSFENDHQSAQQGVFCDLYTDNVFAEFKEFYEAFEQLEDLDKLSLIHEKMYSLIDNKEFGKLRKFLRLFYNESTNVNILKTILVITKGLKDHPELAQTRIEFKEMLEKIIGVQLQ
ncbi:MULTISPECIES: hypothetical protein [unclassified Chitinophaga]|uniref:hypothetical protein n=1 Tax=unclassified Chitinophaga TaxID=2619133 RepID=UPI00300F8006